MRALLSVTPCIRSIAMKLLSNVYGAPVFARHCSWALEIYWCRKKDMFPADSPKGAVTANIYMVFASFSLVLSIFLY